MYYPLLSGCVDLARLDHGHWQTGEMRSGVSASLGETCQESPWYFVAHYLFVYTILA